MKIIKNMSTSLLYDIYEYFFGIAFGKILNYISFFFTDALPNIERVFDHVINGA